MTFPPVPGADWYRRARYLPAYADQLAAVEYGTALADNLTSLMAAIANRDNARVDIPVIGDSVTEGEGATEFGNIWVQQANRAIRAAYPTAANGSAGGLGFIPLLSSGETSYTWPVTLASGSDSTFAPFDLGPVRYTAHAFGATSWTWTAPAGTTSVQLMYYDAAEDGSFTYQVNSDDAVTVSNESGSVDLLTGSITMTDSDVLTVTWVSGDVYVDGIMHYAGDEDSGITFHDCGHFGWCAGTEVNGWNQPETYSLNWAQCYTAFPGLAAIAVMLGINDADAGDGDRTGPEFASDLAGLIATVQESAGALASVPFLLIAEYQPDISVADPAGWSAYVTADRNVAASQASARVCDLAYRLPANNGSAPYWADAYHPTDLGHALIGEIVAAGLRIA